MQKEGRAPCFTARLLWIMVKGKEYRKDFHDTAAIPAHYQVDKPSGFHTEGGGLEFPPPPPQKSWNWVRLLLFCHRYETTILSQIASEAIWDDLNSKVVGGGMPQIPHSGHARLSCYHPVFFPPKLKILYETLTIQMLLLATTTWGSSSCFLPFLSFSSFPTISSSLGPRRINELTATFFQSSSSTALHMAAKRHSCLLPSGSEWRNYKMVVG